MSPELLLIYQKYGSGEFNPEKSDIFSTGLTFLRLSVLLDKNDNPVENISLFSGLNYPNPD